MTPLRLPEPIQGIADKVIERGINIVRDALVAVIGDVETLKASPQWVYVPAASMLNAWVYFGSGAEEVAYWLDPRGKLYMKGVIKNGVIGNAATILPAIARPPRDLNIAVSGATTDGDHA
jgi:hypothetical protein